MNMSIFLGILAAGATMWFGVFKSVSNPSFYLDPHAMTLVLGGTVAASLIGFPLSKLLEVSDSLLAGFFRRKVPDYKVVEQMYEASIYFRKFRDLLNSVEFSHPFMAEGFSLLRNESFTEKHLQEILTKRIAAYKKKLHSDAKILTAIAKFPPAFGLLGASTGMIAMMLNLNKGGSQSIGPAMAIALVATFWGIALSNILLLPLADYANKIAQDDTHTRLIIMEALILIKKNEDPHVMVEILKSHLPSIDRKRIRIMRSPTPFHRAA